MGGAWSRSRRGISATAATLLGVLALLIGLLAFTATTVYLVRAVQAGSAMAGAYAGESKALVKVYAALEMEKSGNTVLNKTYLIFENLWPDVLTIDHIAVASKSGSLIAEKPMSMSLRPGQSIQLKPSDIDPSLSIYDNDFWRFKREIGYIEMHADVGGQGSSFISYPEYKDLLAIEKTISPSTIVTTVTQTMTSTTTITSTATPTTVTSAITRTVTGTVTHTVTNTITYTVTGTVTQIVIPITTTVTRTATVTTTPTSTVTSTATVTVTSTYVTTPTRTVTTTCTLTTCRITQNPATTYAIMRVTGPTTSFIVTATSIVTNRYCIITTVYSSAFLTSTTTTPAPTRAGTISCAVCGTCPTGLYGSCPCPIGTPTPLYQMPAQQASGEGERPAHAIYFIAPIAALALAPTRISPGRRRLALMTIALMLPAILLIPRAIEAQTITTTTTLTSTTTTTITVTAPPTTTTTTTTVTSTITVTSTAPATTTTTCSTSLTTVYKCLGATLTLTFTERPLIISTTTKYVTADCFYMPIRIYTVTVTNVYVSTKAVAYQFYTYSLRCGSWS
jgi:hypothetical protein